MNKEETFKLLSGKTVPEIMDYLNSRAEVRRLEAVAHQTLVEQTLKIESKLTVAEKAMRRETIRICSAIWHRTDVDFHWKFDRIVNETSVYAAFSGDYSLTPPLVAESRQAMCDRVPALLARAKTLHQNKQRGIVELL